MVSALFRGMSITGMLLFGTCTVVIQKIIFNLKGEGRSGTKPHPFEKPWFQTEVMFIGMFGCLAVYEAMNLFKYIRTRRDPEYQPLNQKASSVNGSGSQPGRVKQYILVMAPALCDLVATAMMNVGLLWISASVWQMLRGSMVVFSAVFSRFFLKRKLYASHWVGVCIVAFALTVVAFSSLMPSAGAAAVVSSSSSSDGEEKITMTLQIAGTILVVVAQIIQASQIVVEEFLLKEVDLAPTLIVGLEGFWGGIVCSIVLVGLCFLPKPYGEDSLDTLIMLGKNPKIFFTGVMYAIAILCYNMFGMYVTQTTSAVVRTILEGLRCACIWMTNLFIHYVVTDDPKFGEHWTEWSYLQLCGFLFLLLGMFVYNSIVRIDGFYYPEPAKKEAPKEDEAADS